MAGSETYLTNSPEETEALGVELSRILLPGDIIGLVGELGSGKTCFVRGIAKGLGAMGYVKSPSFTLINVYENFQAMPVEANEEGVTALYHIDLYRIKNKDEFHDAGLEEYIYGKGVSVIEWADKIPELFEECTVLVTFSYVGEREREIVIEFRGSRAS